MYDGLGVVSISDDFIDGVIAHAEPMALRGALYLQTGDETLLSMTLESKAAQDELAELKKPKTDPQPTS